MKILISEIRIRVDQKELNSVHEIGVKLNEELRSHNGISAILRQQIVDKLTNKLQNLVVKGISQFTPEKSHAVNEPQGRSHLSHNFNGGIDE